MSNETTSARSSPVRQTIAVLPVDAAATFLLAVAAGAVHAWPALTGPHVRTLVGLPLVLFAPGYTLLAVLYPAESDGATAVDWFERSDRWLDWPARLALSLGLSVALVPILSLATSIAGLTPGAVPAVVATVVAVGSVLAALRRVRVPRTRRLRVPLPSVRMLVSTGSAGSARFAVRALLTLSVLAATATMGFALVVPSDGESFSSIYLATENETGAQVAGSYPDTFDGDPRELTVGVTNHEDTRTTYTVVAQIQRVDVDGGNATVSRREELRRFRVTLDPGESWNRTHEVAPTTTGEDLRLTYLLYRTPPETTPATADPYRRTFLWVDVTEPATTDGASSDATATSTTPARE